MNHWLFLWMTYQPMILRCINISQLSNSLNLQYNRRYFLLSGISEYFIWRGRRWTYFQHFFHISVLSLIYIFCDEIVVLCVSFHFNFSLFLAMMTFCQRLHRCFTRRNQVYFEPFAYIFLLESQRDLNGISFSITIGWMLLLILQGYVINVTIEQTK